MFSLSQFVHIQIINNKPIQHNSYRLLDGNIRPQFTISFQLNFNKLWSWSSLKYHYLFIIISITFPHAYMYQIH